MVVALSSIAVCFKLQDPITRKLTISPIGTLFPSTEHEKVSHYTEEVCDSLDQSESYNYSAGPTPSIFTDTTTRVASRNSFERTL